MLTRRIDQALEAMHACRARLPSLRDLYRQGSPERAALDALILSHQEAEQALSAWNAAPPRTPPTLER